MDNDVAYYMINKFFIYVYGFMVFTISVTLYKLRFLSLQILTSYTQRSKFLQFAVYYNGLFLD